MSNNNIKQVKLAFCGLQALPNGLRMALWNLCEPIPGHSENSTVSERTLIEQNLLAPDPTGFKRGDIFQPAQQTGA